MFYAVGVQSHGMGHGRAEDHDREDVARCWDREYESGRYENERPLLFVDIIIDMLCERSWTDRRGLYVGCGNGRNFIPLAAKCSDLRGIDVSEVGIRRLLEKYPEYAGRVSCGNFLDGRHLKPRVDYLISIQAFQHGDELMVKKYLEQAAAILRPGGLLFLRINSNDTDVYHRHQITERNTYGGFTVRYAAGPKRGMYIHFFAYYELLQTLRLVGFKTTIGPVKWSDKRSPPETGEWKQWEVVAVRQEPQS